MCAMSQEKDRKRGQGGPPYLKREGVGKSSRACALDTVGIAFFLHSQN